MLSVLHPQYKLEYFKKAGWEPDWINTAEQLVRTSFNKFYATKDNTDDVPMVSAAERVRLNVVCRIH